MTLFCSASGLSEGPAAIGAARAMSQRRVSQCLWHGLLLLILGAVVSTVCSAGLSKTAGEASSTEHRGILLTAFDHMNVDGSTFQALDRRELRIALEQLDRQLPPALPIMVKSNWESVQNYLPQNVSNRVITFSSDLSRSLGNGQQGESKLLAGPRPLLWRPKAAPSGLELVELSRKFPNHSEGGELPAPSKSEFEEVEGDSESAMQPVKLSKILSLAATPFEVTLYLDLDAMVCRDISFLFDAFEGSSFELAIARDASRPHDLYDFNSGVIVYKRTASMRRFLSAWEEYYLSFCVGKGYSNLDQCALPHALHSIPLEGIGVLSPEFNLRPCPDSWKSPSAENASTWHSLVTTGHVSVLHTRMYNQAYDLNTLCALVNQESGRERAFGVVATFEPGIFNLSTYRSYIECEAATGEKCKTYRSTPYYPGFIHSLREEALLTGYKHTILD